MEFDRDLFDLLGAVAGFLGLFISLGSIVYARRQAIAAEGPRSPHVEIAEATWSDQAKGWARVSIVTRNNTNEGWDMETAKLVSPRKGLLIAERYIQSFNDYGEHDVQIPQDTTAFSAITKPWTNVLPPGSGSRIPHGPSADKAREDLYMRLPSGSTNFKIALSFRRKSGIGRPVKLQVVGSMPIQ